MKVLGRAPRSLRANPILSIEQMEIMGDTCTTSSNYINSIKLYVTFLVRALLAHFIQNENENEKNRERWERA